jgi:hypothetical protein
MKRLIGLYFYNIYRSADKEYICISAGNSFFIYHAYGDCCSNSYFEGISIIGNLNKFCNSRVYTEHEAQILNVDFTELREQINDSADHNSDLTRFYGLKISLDNGTIDIDFRNDSNGYYGGSCKFNSELSYDLWTIMKEGLKFTQWIN